MSNPILNQMQINQNNQLNQTNDLMQSIEKSMPQLKQMAQSMKGINDPNALKDMLMKQNPQLGMLLNGGNPQQMVMQKLQSQGIDPNAFIQQLQSIWNG